MTTCATLITIAALAKDTFDVHLPTGTVAGDRHLLVLAGHNGLVDRAYGGLVPPLRFMADPDHCWHVAAKSQGFR